MIANYIQINKQINNQINRQINKSLKWSPYKTLNLQAHSSVLHERIIAELPFHSATDKRVIRSANIVPVSTP